MLIARYSNTNVDGRIVELENKLNISLPAQYKKFLSKYGGGYTPETKYKAGRKSSNLRAFYGFGDVAYSIDKIIDLSEWVDRWLFPIACDSFGNDIAIGIHQEAYGKIFFVDHEADFKPVAIADSFNEFTEKCKSKRISPDVRMTIAEREADLISRGKGSNITDGLRKLWQDEIDTYGNMVQEKLIVEN